MQRRDILQMAALLGSGNLWAQSGQALKLGCPVPMSGPFAANGQFADMGMNLALEQQGTVLGRRLSHALLDTEGKPATAVRKVQEAAQQQGVRFFAGGILSSEALAMGKEIDRAGGVLFTTAGADELTGKDCNRATFRWSVPTFGAIEQTVRPLIGLLPKARRWYTITPQYVFGEGLLGAAKAIFQEKGIEHVGNSYHSLTDKEFSGHLTNAIAAKPDVLLLLNFGTQSSDALRQAVSFGMHRNMTILVAWASGLEQFETLGADLCDGIYFGAQYWHTVDAPLNRELFQLCASNLKRVPNYSLAGSYICTRIMLDALARSGSDNPKAVIAALEGLQYDGLTGREEIRKADHQVIKDYYLLRGKPKARMRDAADFADVVSAGKSFLPVGKTGCSLAA